MSGLEGMQQFILFALLFISGSFIGYVIEVFFRRFVSAKRWVNPGFLTGPCLPLYGFVLLFLFYSSIGLKQLSFAGWPVWLKDTIIILIFGLGMTLIEYIAGLIFIKGLKVKLWDYSNIKGNIQGIICPLFSIFWLIIGGFYFFFLQDAFEKYVAFYFSYEKYLDWILGVCCGFLIYDLIISFNLAAKLSSAAKRSKILVSYTQFRISRNEEKKRRKQQFLADNPSIQYFIDEQKKREKELIGHLVFKEEGHKFFHISAKKAKMKKEKKKLEEEKKPS